MHRKHSYTLQDRDPALLITSTHTLLSRTLASTTDSDHSVSAERASDGT
jgi:hypothetical protein